MLKIRRRNHLPSNAIRFFSLVLVLPLHRRSRSLSPLFFSYRLFSFHFIFVKRNSFYFYGRVNTRHCMLHSADRSKVQATRQQRNGVRVSGFIRMYNRYRISCLLIFFSLFSIRAFVLLSILRVFGVPKKWNKNEQKVKCTARLSWKINLKSSESISNDCDWQK